MKNNHYARQIETKIFPHFSGETKTQPTHLFKPPGKQVAVNFHQLYSQNQPQLPTIMVHYVFQAPGFCVDQFPMFAKGGTPKPNLPPAAASHPWLLGHVIFIIIIIIIIIIIYYYLLFIIYFIFSDPLFCGF